jgi:arsenate reductase-like glutaredoxin family protein
LTIAEQASAAHPLGADRARALVKDAKRLLVMKGRKVAVFDLTKDKPRDAELLELMLGTTGNLRAPVVVRGGTVLVGFNEDVYGDELG